MSGYKSQPKFWQVIQDNLPYEFDCEIVNECVSQSDALAEEKRLIERYDLIDNGCNSIPGSNSNDPRKSLNKFQEEYLKQLKELGMDPMTISKRLGLIE